MDDLDNKIRDIDNLKNNLKELNSKTFTLEEIMTDDFIKLHTTFTSFDIFLDKATFEIDDYEDIEKNIYKFNLYVSSVSKFQSWEEMVDEALLNLLDFTE